MKKILLFSLIALGAQTSYAYPNIDITAGGMPFRIMEQQQFQKMEFNDFKKFKDANDYDVEKRFDEPSKIQQEYKIKNLKKPAKIMLGQPKELPSTDMELIQKDGKVQIKYQD